MPRILFVEAPHHRELGPGDGPFEVGKVYDLRVGSCEHWKQLGRAVDAPQEEPKPDGPKLEEPAPQPEPAPAPEPAPPEPAPETTAEMAAAETTRRGRKG